MGSSVSITSKPQKLVLSGNPILYKVKADNYLLSAGKKSEYWLYYTYHLGEILGLTYKGVETLIVSGTEANQWNANNETLASFLSKDPNLSEHFDIRSTDQYPNLTMFYSKKESSEKLVVSFHQNPDPGVEYGFQLDEINAGEDRAKRSLHRVVTNFLFDSGIIRNDYQVSDSGEAEIDISPMVQKEKTGHFTFPEMAGKYFTLHSILDVIKLQFYEKWSGGNSILVSADDLYVLQGKLPVNELAELNDLGNTFYSSLAGSGKFLTDQPAEKVTDIYAPERLYWYCKDSGSHTLKVTFYYTDDTWEIKSSDVSVLEGNSIYEISTCYKLIRMSTTKKIERYDVQVFRSNQFVSPVQSYVIDYSYQEHARYFYIRNKYGVYDLLRVTGKASKKKKITKQAITLSLPNTVKSTDRQIKQISSASGIVYSLNSGYQKSSEENEWVARLLESTDVYWLKKGKAYPSLILDNDNQVYKDGEYNNFLEFDLVHGNADDIVEEFSALEPIDLPGDYNIDYNTDYFTGASDVPADPTEPDTSNLIFQSDFTNWVTDPDPLFPSQPIGLDVFANTNLSSVANCVNDGNKMRFNVTDVGIEIGIMLRSPLTYFEPGTYKFTINVDEFSGLGVVLNVGGNHSLSLGLNEITIVATDYVFTKIRICRGSSVISNIRIESV